MEKLKYLVVVDPSQEQHLALDRMVRIMSRHPELESGIHIVIGADLQLKPASDRPGEVVISKNWWQELLAPLRELEADFTAECFWTRDWRQSIIDAADRHSCDVILLSRSSAEVKGGLTESKWALLRRVNCDVTVVGNQIEGPLQRVLVALDATTEDEVEKKINRLVLERGKLLSVVTGAEMHVVNAHPSTENWPYKADLRKQLDVPEENIQVKMGKPEVVIAEVAESLGADMIVIGSRQREGVRGILVGNTIEKLLDHSSVDVRVVQSGD